MGRTYYFAEKDMEKKRVKRLDEEVRQIEQREERKSLDMLLPADMWLESGLEEGGVLVIHRDANVREKISGMLQREGYKVQAVMGGRQAMSAFRKASYDLIIIHWGLFQNSSDLVNLFRKALPSTRIIITSPRFGWAGENSAAAQLGMEAVQAGAYSYIPERYIERTVMTCVDSALNSKEKACPVLMSGRSCNLQCTI